MNNHDCKVFQLCQHSPVVNEKDSNTTFSSFNTAKDVGFNVVLCDLL